MLHSIRLTRGVGRVLGFKRSLIKFEIQLTREVGLFDRDHYLTQVRVEDLQGMSPLKHYVLVGDDLGLSPSPLFDTRHYDRNFRQRHGVNRLLHYALVARFRGISPTPWFDPEYYLQANPDVTASRQDALVHFQRWGWREGRSPLPGLDLRRLMVVQPELRVSKGNPLALFCDGRLGEAVRRQAEQQDARGTRSAVMHALRGPHDEQEPAANLLDPQQWVGVEPLSFDAPPQVSVIVPVYSGVQESLRCLWTVLHAPVKTPFELIVINDAGPAPELNAMLRSLAARGLFHLEQHRQNQGFVRTVNHGLRLSKDHDAIILNADTEVYGDWIDRMLEHARQFPRVATITPLSNNATICSYPETLNDNRHALELPHAEIDALAAQVNRLSHVEAPTGVGFCMYIRRSALREVGWLDDRRFGRGYGEENDLCQRLIRRGWSNVVACDIYVRHVGSVSFAGEAMERTAKAVKILNKLYPDYEAQVNRYIDADPAWPHRLRIDLARLQRQCGTRNVLLVCHNRGGGTERHLLEQTQALMARGHGVFELRPSHRPDCLSLIHPALFSLHNAATIPLTATALLHEALRSLRIDEIHLHHLIDFPAATAKALLQACGDLGISLRVAVHDYYAMCPRVNLVNDAGRYCGEPTAAECDRCLSADPQLAQAVPISRWRTRSVRLLQQAEQVIVPSDDVARRLRAMAPSLRMAVEPHEPLPPARAIPQPLVAPGQVLRVMVIGAISRIKGFDVVRGLATVAREQGLPLRVALQGYSMDDPVLAAQGVQMLGRYFDNELAARIEADDPHIILIPSIWPETYCYVLSSAMASGRRVAVFDIGAQADRAREHDPAHLVLPLAMADDPQALAGALMSAALASPVDSLRVAA